MLSRPHSSVAPLLGLLLVLLSPVATSADTDKADDDWVVAAKARSPSDISLWTRTIPGAELKAFRGATEVKVPMESMVAFLYDARRMDDWMFRCKDARILAEAADGTAYVHIRINGIWPLEDRDAVVKVVPEYVAATGELRLTGSAAPDYLPPQKGHVRIPAIESTWLMRPADDGRLYVEWSGHVDPGGSVPRWLANAVATLIPRYTIKRMREEVARPHWQQPGPRGQGTQLIEQIRRQPAR